MAILKTYENCDVEDIIAATNANIKGPYLLPGDWVRHIRHLKSFGLVVGRGDNIIAVLWSRPPIKVSFNQAVAQNQAQQICDEEDTQIMRMMQAMAINDQ